MSVIAVIGTLDSKGEEHQYVAELIRKRGHEPLLIDLGTGGEPSVKPDVTRYEVAEAAGLDLEPILERKDRGECVSAMSQAAPVFLLSLVEEGKIQGVISLGGGGGTALGTAAMRALPVGFPKLMVSTLASGNTAHYVGTKDIVMMPSVVDVAGLNSLSRMIFTRAAGAITGMVEAVGNFTSSKPQRTTVSSQSEEEECKPIIVASMFGNTTDCVNVAKQYLEKAGYEVLIFHATGVGGRTMEALIESGMVKGVLDLTTTEWADEVTGATLSAGATRLDDMSQAGVPVVIAPGCLDMANFGEPETVPAHYAQRLFYLHNPQVTLMRTNAEEGAELGKIIAEKANKNPAPTKILIPRKAISVISAAGQPFHDPEADRALFNALHDHATCEVVDYEEEINSPRFAEAAARTLIELISTNQNQ